MRSKFILLLISFSFIFLILYVYSGGHQNDETIKEASGRPIFSFPILPKSEKMSDKLKKLRAGQNYSTCSEEATAFGRGQKVISYSLYINEQTNVSLFLSGIKPNLQSIPLLYPGWVVRIYTDEVQRIQNASPDLTSEYKFLFWCDVTKIPGIGDMSSMVAMTWRFLPLGDPTVDIFISRDLDSRISPRERKAVEEWENSNYSLHAMRDHPYHGVPYLGGMWGANNKLLGRERSVELQDEIIEASFKIGGKSRGQDQNLLADLYNKKLSTETMAHDSYFCKNFPDKLNLGFPTRRESPDDFVGNVFGDPGQVYKAEECPETCRRHKEWTNC